ncbi:hypothetical protein Tco_0155716 [Tanacetum coccineum]
MDDPNITMKEYIRLEEENAHRRGKVYNWETATYDKICYCPYARRLSIETDVVCGPHHSLHPAFGMYS